MTPPLPALALLAALGAAAFVHPAAAQSARATFEAAPDAYAAAAFVDGKAITNFDLEQRARLLDLAAPAQGDRTEAALESMIEDRLKRTAAENAGISVPREEVEQGLARFAAAQNLDAARLERRLRAAGVAPSVLREFVETELMWSALIRRNYLAQAEVDEAELDAEIEAAGLDATVSFDLGEIAIAVGGDRAAARARAEAVAAELRGGADFSAVARRVSRAPSAPQGGRVGWVPRAQLPPGLAEVLSGQAPGTPTEPFAVPGGFIILTVFERREEPRELTEQERENVRLRLLETRLARRAEGRLQELRARAYVERR